MNLSIGPGRVSRLFRACAYWSMVPWLFLGWVFLGVFGINQLTIGLYCFVPIFLFMPFAILSPNSRRVRCAHCDYDRDFPARPRQ